MLSYDGGCEDRLLPDDRLAPRDRDGQRSGLTPAASQDAVAAGATIIRVGTAIFGGTALNSGNVLFVTGTHDNIVYGINSVTGKIIWEYKMVAAGSAPPTLFKYQNKQYLVVFSSGGSYYEYKDKSSSVYIFTIKDN